MQTTPQELCDEKGSLFEKALTLVNDAINKKDKSAALLARELGIGYFWLNKFRRGQIANPSVNRIQYIIEELSGSKLKVD